MALMPSRAPGLPSPPWVLLREQLLEQAAGLEHAGDQLSAARLREAVGEWWEAQQSWNHEVADLLRVHHEINNALVGVSGNAQLMMMGAPGQQPGVRERLEVILRESGRIEQGARRLRDLRMVFAPDTAAGMQGGPRV